MGRKVLVVDDEPAILRLLHTALAARGYEVHAVDHPQKALELVRSLPCFDLVVSDIIMPEMCGPELIRRIAPLCPNIAVLLMSAHIAEESLPPNASFISKPFGIPDLCSIVGAPAPAVIPTLVPQGTLG